MLGELQRRTAMADGKIGLAKRPGALAEFLLQRPVLHLVDEVERPGTDLRLGAAASALRAAGAMKARPNSADSRAERWRVGMVGFLRMNAQADISIAL